MVAPHQQNSRTAERYITDESAQSTVYHDQGGSYSSGEYSESEVTFTVAISEPTRKKTWHQDRGGQSEGREFVAQVPEREVRDIESTSGHDITQGDVIEVDDKAYQVGEVDKRSRDTWVLTLTLQE
jgi:hypothetical protein